MSDRKAEFWWASIAGADPEPVEKAEHDGRPCVYTLGCGDPFYLDEVPCPVEFVPSYSNYSLTSMVRPKHPNQLRAEQASRAAELAATPKGGTHWGSHGWRGPR